MIRKLLLGTVLALALAAPAFAFVPTYADDAAVLGKGNMQLFFDLESASWPGGVDTSGLATTFTYGLDDKWDLWAELPLIFDNGNSDSGLSDLTVGAKWAFGKAGEWDLSLGPYLTLPTGNEKNRLGYGAVNFGATLIASWAQPNKGPWSVDLNFGLFTVNTGGDLPSNTDTGWALTGEGEYSLDDFWTLVGELTFENGGTDTAQSLLLGASYALNRDVEIGGGLRLGLNDYAADSVILIGVTVGL
jgi:hypothetical protein